MKERKPLKHLDHMMKLRIVVANKIGGLSLSQRKELEEEFGISRHYIQQCKKKPNKWFVEYTKVVEILWKEFKNHYRGDQYFDGDE